MKSAFTILGGGIAGLTAAIALKAIGIEATVFEAAPAFKPVGAGLVLAANAMKAYQHLGLYDQLTAAGQDISQFTFYDDKGKVITRTSTGGLKNGLANFTVHRAALQKVLLSHLQNGQVITGKRSKDIVTTNEGYTIFFDDGTEVNTKFVIVAEGINSAIRKKILPNAQLRFSGYTCWRGITDNTGLNINETSETWGTKGRFGIVPLIDNKIYWFACKNAKAADERMKQYGVNELAANFKDYHSPIISIIRSTPAEHIIWNDIIDLKPQHHYTVGNIVFIGDAAHATTPNMGQGACQAIEDAVILASCINNNTVIEEAFKTFEQKRLKRTHYIVNQSSLLGKVAQLENESLASFRNLIFRSLPQKFFQKQVEKVYDINFN